MVEGKSPIFVIEAVMRVCGTCHAAHAITSCEAFEHALGIIPPRDGMLLREAESSGYLSISKCDEETIKKIEEKVIEKIKRASEYIPRLL